MKDTEITICGLAAVRARFERDSSSIVRLFFDRPMSKRVGLMCKALAASRKVYRCVEPAELEKISGTLHHGGIVAVVAAPKLRAPTKAEVAEWAAQRAPLLLLDRIGNAHNLGAIARTAAFFGVPRLVISSDPAAAQPGASAFRVAEGGLEAVELFRVPDLAEFCRGLAPHYLVAGAAAHGRALTPPQLRARAGALPIALVLGNEERGLGTTVAGACVQLVHIPGRGRVESLNVSAAAAVLIWELLARGK